MKNEYKITKDLMKSWAKEYHLYGKANIVSFIIGCFVSIIGIAGFVFSILLKFNWVVPYAFALIAVVSIYKLFFARFIIWSNRYKLYSTTYCVTEWMRTTEFLEDEIVLTDHTSVSKLKYGNIAKIKEKNNVVMIFMNNNLALRLYKDAFVEGSWEECKEMILKKKNS